MKIINNQKSDDNMQRWKNKRKVKENIVIDIDIPDCHPTPKKKTAHH